MACGVPGAVQADPAAPTVRIATSTVHLRDTWRRSYWRGTDAVDVHERSLVLRGSQVNGDSWDGRRLGGTGPCGGSSMPP